MLEKNAVFSPKNRQFFQKDGVFSEQNEYFGNQFLTKTNFV